VYLGAPYFFFFFFYKIFITYQKKKAGAVDIKDINDFRPNSLVGGVYHIISKVLAGCWRRSFQVRRMRLLG